MSIATRSARAVWEGPISTGSGQLNSDSGALTGLEVSWASRTEQPDGKTSPEELAAAAHSSCFSMALAVKLGERGTSAQRLDIEATVTLDDVNGLPTITSSALRITARIDGIDATEFQQAVDEASALCPVSRLFAGAQISVKAVLDQSSTG